MAAQAHTRDASGRENIQRAAHGDAVSTTRARPPEDTTDYAHRHFVNLAATAFLLLIAIAVIWTVRAMDDYEKLQRCLSAGRRDCVDLNLPVKPGIRLPTR